MLLNKLTGETEIAGTDVHILYTLESLTWIENNLPGVSPMELVERGRSQTLSVRQSQILLWAGMEAYRRRSGLTASGRGEVNPAEALKVIKAGGGLFRVMPQVASAFARAPDLGLMPASANDEGGEPVDPTTAVPSSDASSESDTTPPPPGA